MLSSGHFKTSHGKSHREKTFLTNIYNSRDFYMCKTQLYNKFYNDQPKIMYIIDIFDKPHSMQEKGATKHLYNFFKKCLEVLSEKVQDVK